MIMLLYVMLLGNPSLFSFHTVLHDSWPASQGPAKDTYYIGIIIYITQYSYLNVYELIVYIVMYVLCDARR